MENGAQYPVLQYKVFTLRLKQQGHPETVLNDVRDSSRVSFHDGRNSTDFD
jgi:hypothetical protein